MKRLILLAALALSACKSEGDRFADDYERAKSDPHLHGADMCAAATSAASAYQQEHDLDKASEWRSKAQLSCAMSAPARINQ